MNEEFKKASHKRTICEILREMHDAGDEAVKLLAEEAITIAKKMDAKLREYKADWDAGFYGVNEDQDEDRARRAKA